MEYQIKNGGLSAIIDARGAQLRSVRLQSHEYLWQGDPAYWEDQSPLLFPFVGRFTEGKYTCNGKEYQLPIHGFASDMVFEAEQILDDSIRFVLTDSEETRALYPGRFRLTVTYALGGDDAQGSDSAGGSSCARICENPASSSAALSVSYRVENLSTDEPMYFGIGGHPGFQVPMEDGLKFEDYRLVFSKPHTPTRVGHTQACFLSGIDESFPLENGTDLPLHHDMFDDDAIVLKNVADTVTLCSAGGSRSVTMSYPGLPYLGLWHAPKTDAPYICIEPWTSLPSRQDIVEEFTCKADLLRLEPEGVWQGGWQMQLT